MLQKNVNCHTTAAYYHDYDDEMTISIRRSISREQTFGFLRFATIFLVYFISLKTSCRNCDSFLSRNMVFQSQNFMSHSLSRYMF